jgi:Tol biopolymer transport system component
MPPLVLMTLPSGTRLGPYAIRYAIGQGAMGVVYRAHDARLQRDVAIKVLLPAVAGDPDRLARFRREAQVLASLNHQNIAAIYGLEEMGDEHALVLEMVDGPTLADRLKEGPLPLDDALAIARQIADALDAAHERGIVHRDLKPANIKVRPDGMVKVLDFGLAKALEAPVPAPPGELDTTSSPTLSVHATTAGVILGTAAYMSPEQASGKPVDKRTDIWAFGVVLWEMVTGRRMFEGETVSHVLAAVLTQEPDLSLAPARVRPLLERCLVKYPTTRLRDIGDAAILLSAPRVPDRLDQVDPSRLRRTAAIGWLVAAAMAALALVFGLTSQLRSDVQIADAPVVRLQIARQSVDPYNNAAGAFALSPDGRLLAYYVSGADGRATLSLQTLATGERREVPGSAVQSPIPPFWSPDSRHVAYVSLRAALVLDLVTGTTRELCLCRFQGGSWNRDGVILLGSSAADPGPIRRVSLDDRTTAAVTSPNGAMDSAPAFLPDGRRFLFARTHATGGTTTYLGTLDGGEPTRITDGARSLFADRPGVGPHLLGIDAAGLVAQPLDLDTMTLRGEPFVVVAGAASASIADVDLLVASAAATDPITVPTWYDRRGTSLGVVGPAGTIQGVAISPDGRTVAVSDPSTGLWLRDDAGANRRLVERGDAPVWSPDGLRLLLTAAGTPRQIHERAADGTGQERPLFPADRNAFANDWSRAAESVIYTQPKGGVGGGLDLDLWAITLASPSDRAAVPYLDGPTRDAQAEFSPDGRFVAYTSVTDDDPQVFVQPFPNASDGRWQVSSAGGSEPHWSPDGRELFYFAGQTLMVAPVRLQPTFSSGPAVSLFDAPVQPWYVNDTDRWQVARDGRRFLLLVPAGDTSTPPIDVVVNWPTLLRR